jgi:DAK2 domain fusion protein YloV
MVKFEKEKLKGNSFNEENFRNDLSQYGDSLLVISDDELAKVHIHSEEPGKVLTYGQQYGSLINMKIENMRQQHTNIVGETHNQLEEQPSSKKEQEYGIVTVTMGQGVAELFKSIGADVVIEGGQTMNPSTEDIVNAIEKTNAKKVIVLPNNKNIIMAAEQAAEVSSKDVIVIPSKTVPQGMSAMLAFNPQSSFEVNNEAMNEALGEVKSGQVTYAVRETTIDGIAISKDDYMGIQEGKIVCTNPDLITVSRELLQKMLDEDTEILTILYGEGVTSEQVKTLQDFISEQYKDVEIEIHDGKQPLYSFIFAVE